MSPKQQKFVIEYLKTGKKELAYERAYPNAKGRSLTVGADRLLKKEQVQEAIAIVRMRMRAETEFEIKDIISNTLMSVKEKRAILAQIARGDLTVETINKHSRHWLDTYHREPTQRERILAIKLDCEIASGRYDPDKIDKRVSDLANSLHRNKRCCMSYHASIYKISFRWKSSPRLRPATGGREEPEEAHAYIP